MSTKKRISFCIVVIALASANIFAGDPAKKAVASRNGLHLNGAAIKKAQEHDDATSKHEIDTPGLAAPTNTPRSARSSQAAQAELDALKLKLDQAAAVRAAAAAANGTTSNGTTHATSPSPVPFTVIVETAVAVES